jgi:hypothetical protein
MGSASPRTCPTGAASPVWRRWSAAVCWATPTCWSMSPRRTVGRVATVGAVTAWRATMSPATAAFPAVCCSRNSPTGGDGVRGAAVGAGRAVDRSASSGARRTPIGPPALAAALHGPTPWCSIVAAPLGNRQDQCASGSGGGSGRGACGEGPETFCTPSPTCASRCPVGGPSTAGGSSGSWSTGCAVEADRATDGSLLPS